MYSHFEQITPYGCNSSNVTEYLYVEFTKLTNIRIIGLYVFSLIYYGFVHILQ